MPNRSTWPIDKFSVQYLRIVDEVKMDYLVSESLLDSIGIVFDRCADHMILAAISAVTLSVT